jgi:hypothetical protein
VTCPVTEPAFVDVRPGSVHADNIDCGAALGLLLGRSEGLFVPGGELTRAQTASILDRLATATGRPISGSGSSFPDVASSNVHADAIARLAAAGVIHGFPDGTFGPHRPITRAQLNSLVVRFVETQTGVSLPLGEPFADVRSIRSTPTRCASREPPGCSSVTPPGTPSRTTRSVATRPRASSSGRCRCWRRPRPRAVGERWGYRGRRSVLARPA